MVSDRISFLLIRLIPLFLLSTGCATLTIDEASTSLSPEQQAVVTSRVERLQSTQSFYLSARLAVDANGNAWNGVLRWQQMPDSYLINFNAPLGQGALQLQGNNGVVELKLADGRVETAEDAESLLYQETGLEFPLNGLRYWVMGIPRPQTDSESQFDPLSDVVLNVGGNIASMQESGWSIEYPRYRSVAMAEGEEASIDMPRKIVMKNDGVKIRIVIDQWQAGK